jgi:small subunit ribosomal protein S18
MLNTQRRRKPGGRRFFPRRKVCQFCVDKVSIDYKDVVRNKRFISEWGKIESRRKTGTCSPHQRQLATAIKRARFLALLPYTGSHSLMELTRSNPRGDQARRPFRGPDSTPPPPPSVEGALPAYDAPAAAAAPEAAAAPAAEVAVAEVAESVVEETSKAETDPADEPAAEEAITDAPAEEAGSEESSDDSK